VGERFDANIHQAVGKEDNTAVPDETVTQVYQKGYAMGDRVLRSAMVVVSQGGPRDVPADADADADADAPEDDAQ
jgi:molecular chaperone GrpE